ncbi:MAG: carboxypeptidase regulatory-like domain-containing protein, partial [Planctomycetota bacterium]
MPTAREEPASPRRKILLSLALSVATIAGFVILFALLGRWGGRRDAGEFARRDGAPAAETSGGGGGEEARAEAEGAGGPSEAAERDEEAEAEAPILRGRVTGEGAGIAGARVHLFSVREIERAIERLEGLLPQGELPDVPSLVEAIRGELDRFRRSAVVAKTDGEGIYEFYRIEPGGYVVLATADEWLFRYGDVASLEAGRTEVLDIELSRGAAIAGRVLGTDGRGMEGVSVLAEYRPPGIPSIGRTLRRMVAYVNGEFLKGPFECRSAPDGSFRLAALPPGVYDLHAQAPDRPETTLSGVPTGSADVVIYIGQGAEIRGRLADFEGLPLEGVAVALKRLEEGPQLPLVAAPFSKLLDSIARLAGDEPRVVLSGERGAFSIDHLSPGRYRLQIEERGVLPFDREVELSWGEVLDLGLVRVDRGEAISGWVLSENGSPIEGARVAVAPGRPNFLNIGTAFNDFLTGRLLAATGPTGLFRLGGLVPGEYQVIATARGHAPGSVRGARAGGEPLTIRLAPGARISGRVVALGTGAPIAGARVRAGEVRATADEDGRFELDGVAPRERWREIFSFPGAPERSEPANAVRIEAAAPGYLDARESYDLSLGREIAIVLAPAPEIRGTVLDPDGKPAPGSLVRLVPWVPERMPAFLDFVGDGSIFLAVSVTDLEGRFRLSGFRGGRAGQLYRVAADHVLYARSFSEPFRLEGRTEEAGRAVGVELVQPPEGMDGSDARPAGRPGAEVVVRLEPRAQIHGVVADSKGPVPAAAIRLSRQPESPDPNVERGFAFLDMLGLPKGGRVVYTNREGRFSHDGLRPGRYVVACEVAGFIDPPAQTAEIAAGEVKELNFTVEAGGEIRGVVADPAGAPVAGAQIRCLREPGAGDEEGRRVLEAQRFLGGAYRTARSGPEGEFAVVGLPPGLYAISAEKPGYARGEVSGAAPGEAEIRLVLVPAGSIAVAVADAASGAPIPRFSVSIRRKDGGARPDASFGLPLDASDPYGRFVRDGLEPGAYDVEVSAPGYASASAPADVAPGAVSERSFLLVRSGSVAGIAFDAATGTPVAGARVSIAEEAETGGAETASELAGAGGAAARR